MAGTGIKHCICDYDSGGLKKVGDFLMYLLLPMPEVKVIEPGCNLEWNIRLLSWHFNPPLHKPFIREKDHLIYQISSSTLGQ